VSRNCIAGIHDIQCSSSFRHHGLCETIDVSLSRKVQCPCHEVAGLSKELLCDQAAAVNNVPYVPSEVNLSKTHMSRRTEPVYAERNAIVEGCVCFSRQKRGKKENEKPSKVESPKP